MDPPSAPPRPEPGAGYAEPATACPARSRSPGSAFVGVVGDDVLASGPRFRECNLSEQASAGVGIVRTSFSWEIVERTSGFFNTSYYDRYVLAMAAHGLRVLPVLYYPPAHRSKGPAGAERARFYPPRSNAAFGRFARLMAKRYGPSGTLWAENPATFKLPIRSWQIWNEPNLKLYWPPKANARQYTRLLAAASKQIKSVDPRAEIVTAGLPESRIGVPVKRYLADMYRAGAARWFDTVAVNAYAPTAGGVMARLRETRRVMSKAGDSRARLWATEVGWATSGPAHPFRLSAAGQARQIGRLYRAAYAARRKLRLRGVVYYSWLDAQPYREDFWGLHTGLLDRLSAPKPGLDAFKRVAAKYG
ncbi:MAG: hypothetical protein H0V29_04000 [Thermoleophilaceae bacterium]|nr:hypothetical protein [Thermoleophilaceae bacterium]